MKTIATKFGLSIAFLLFVASQSFASSTYVDNPNFDVEVSSQEAHRNERQCVGWCGTGVASGSYVKYHETVNGDTIEDRCLCLGWPSRCSGDLNTEPQTSAVYYIDRRLANRGGLYALAEVAYDEEVYAIDGVSEEEAEANRKRNAVDSSVKVFLDLVESRGRATEKLLFRKAVFIKGSDRWHVIASDFPVYKTMMSRDDEDNERYRTLALRVVFTDTVRARRCYLNFAQVSDSTLSLGGRGRRDRDPQIDD